MVGVCRELGSLVAGIPYPRWIVAHVRGHGSRRGDTRDLQVLRGHADRPAPRAFRIARVVRCCQHAVEHDRPLEDRAAARLVSFDRVSAGKSPTEAQIESGPLLRVERGKNDHGPEASNSANTDPGSHALTPSFTDAVVQAPALAPKPAWFDPTLRNRS